MSPAVVGLMPVNRGGVGSEAGDKQSGEVVGPPKRNNPLTDNFSCQLKQHIHHSQDKPFECNICRYRFEFKGHMLRHKANNHPDELAAEEADADELPAKITTPTVNPDESEVYQCPWRRQRSGLDMMLQNFPDTWNLELVLEDNFDHDLDFSMRYSQPQDTSSSLPQTRRSLPTGGVGNDSSVYDMAEPGASTTQAKGKIDEKKDEEQWLLKDVFVEDVRRVA
ncbi:hypothetical protein pipiens_004313 [Culex pipiens pipiens]|uniref:C2H2-type domain-containing protein n=1 Tax=Culex pipiens pipiens TaxID=38569 RepID=A0ABD1CK05_CULPP